MGRGRLKIRVAIAAAWLVFALGCEDVLQIINDDVYKTYSLTIIDDGHGSIDPEGTVTAEHGALIDISSTPNPEYTFDKWQVVKGKGVNITDVYESSTQVSLSGGNATIQARCKTGIVVASPNGKEVFARGTTMEIRWTKTIVDNVSIELYLGDILHTPPLSGNAVGEGPFSWTIPSDWDRRSWDCRIRITNRNSTAMWDESDEPFIIEGLDIEIPNAQSVFQKGAVYTIQWDGSGLGYVKIALIVNDSPKCTISEKTENDGAFEWLVPQDMSLDSGSSCEIEIQILDADGNPIGLSTTSDEFQITGWTDFGVVDSIAADQCDIAVGTDGLPAVLLREKSSKRTKVYKFTNTAAWDDLGYASPGQSDYSSLAVNTSNNIWVIFQDGDGSPDKSAQVRSCSVSTGNWTDDIPSPGSGEVSYTRIVANPSDSYPYVVFSDSANEGKASVRKLTFNFVSGWTWLDRGYASEGTAEYADIVLDPADNKPVVVSRDSGIFLGGSGHIKKWSAGTTWSDLGTVGGNLITDTRIAVNGEGKRVVVYEIFSAGPIPGYQLKAVRHDGGTDWTSLGVVGYGGDSCADIAADPVDDAMWVVFKDEDSGVKRARVEKLGEHDNWVTMGYASPAGSDVQLAAIAVDPVDTNPVVVFLDASDGSRARVYKWQE